MRNNRFTLFLILSATLLHGLHASSLSRDDAPETQEYKTPLDQYSKALATLKIPETFKSIYANSKSNTRAMRFIPKKEEPENWTEMIMVIGTEKNALSFDEVFTMMKKFLEDEYSPKTLNFSTLSRSKNGDVETAVISFDLPFNLHEPKQTNGQHNALQKIIVWKDKVLSFQYLIRCPEGALPKEKKLNQQKFIDNCDLFPITDFTESSALHS